MLRAEVSPPAATVMTGLLYHWDDFHLEDGLTDPDNLHVMLAGVITLLMIQLQSISRTVIVFLTALLGLIGVTMALLVFRVPLGFIALAGMIIRNAVILVDEIRQDEEDGKTQWQAIVSFTVRCFRPIMLTACAAILAMIPLTRQVFWGPIAVSIMGGLVVATLLTCLFLPALYAARFRVKEG
jgi:multidrug efflux pump subunit AcrB